MMINLNNQNLPIWLEPAPGVRIRVKRITPQAIIQAQDAASDVFKAGVAAGRDLKADRDLGIEAGVAMVRRFAHFGVVEWEGVADQDGQPAPVTPENIDLAVDVWPIYDTLDREYVAPALSRQEEKNGLAN